VILTKLSIDDVRWKYNNKYELTNKGNFIIIRIYLDNKINSYKIKSVFIIYNIDAFNK